MPTAMYMRWPAITLDQYDEAREKVDWEGDVPDGAIFHVASHDGDRMRVFDLWESPEKFQAFVESRLMPVIKGDMGIDQEPEVVLCEVHNMFAPNGIEAGAGMLV
jgi:hypothetical protein